MKNRVIIGKTNYNYKLSTLTTTAMKQEKLYGDPMYASPTLTCTEITVEQGFAQSDPESMYSMPLDAPDYTDGVTL